MSKKNEFPQDSTPQERLTAMQNAEALKEIQTLPFIAETPKEVLAKEEVCKDPMTFQKKVGYAQMAKKKGEGVDYVIVDQEMFDYLVSNQKTNYLTYGNPGIKVYKEGTKQTYDDMDNMTAEDYLNKFGRKA